MRKLSVFQNISVDGYFVDRQNDMAWAHTAPDPEFDAFTNENAQGGEGAFLFGRITYDLMASFWPTEQARQMMPVVAEKMNRTRKLVFSRTRDKLAWANSELLRGEPAEEVRKLQAAPGPDLLIMGSGSIVAPLAAAGLIDEYQLVLNPLALGGGRSMFEGLPQNLKLKLTRSRVFGNGKVFLCYEPLK
jgi:dihydrofolate reductase